MKARYRPAQAEPKPSSPAEVQAPLDSHAKTLVEVQDAARRLPPGRERWQAIRTCLAAGMRKAEVARLAEGDIPF